MDYNFKRIADVEEIESVSEDTMFLVNDGGVIKQAHAQMQGGGWPSDLPKPSVGGFGYTEQGDGAVITWDGNTEGRDTISVSVQGMTINYCKVAEKGTGYTDTATYTDSESDHVADLLRGDGAIAYVTDFPYVIIADGGEFNLAGFFGGTAPSSGVYFAYMDGIDNTSSLTYGTPETIHKIDEKYLPEGDDMSAYEKVSNRTDSINYHPDISWQWLNKVYPTVGAIWNHVGTADFSVPVTLFEGTVNLRKPFDEATFVYGNISGRLRHYYDVQYCIDIDWVDTDDYIQDDSKNCSQHESDFMIGNGHLNWDDVRDTGEKFCLCFYGDDGYYSKINPDHGAYLYVDHPVEGSARVKIMVLHDIYKMPDFEYYGVYNLRIPTWIISDQLKNKFSYLSDADSDGSFEREVNHLFDTLEDIYPAGTVKLADWWGRTWECTYCTDGRKWDSHTTGVGEYITGVHRTVKRTSSWGYGEYTLETQCFITITRNSIEVRVIETEIEPPEK